MERGSYCTFGCHCVYSGVKKCGELGLWFDWTDYFFCFDYDGRKVVQASPKKKQLLEIDSIKEIEIAP